MSNQLTLRLLICVFALNVGSNMACAQIDSVLLDSAVVTVRGGQPLQQISDFTRSETSSIGDVLSQQGLVFVKPIAGSGLSTLSIRGGTPEQSPVFWNGLSLQNTLNGNVDLNLLPAFAFDDIEINNSISVRNGSGATAGSVELISNQYDTTTNTKLTAGIASFNGYNAAIKSTVIGRNNRFSLLSYTRGQTNDYPIESLTSPTTKTNLSNAHVSMTGGILQYQQQVKNANPLNIRLWAQTAYREIPPTQLEAESKKHQIDNHIRLQSDWSKLLGKTEVKLIAGSFLEHLRYHDSVAQLYTEYAFINNSLLLHGKRRLNKALVVGIDLEARHFGADADTFYNQSRIEFSQGGHAKWTKGKWNTYAGARVIQFSSTSNTPVLYSIQVNREIRDKWEVYSSISSNYRLPTFNSLYWNPGGNADLLPEKSTNSEVAVAYQRQQVGIKAIAFHNVIRDQIRWIPGIDGIFTAQQIINQVQWNRGLEVLANGHFKNVSATVGLSQLWSTVQGDTNQWQQSFVPQYQGNANVVYQLKRWRLKYGWQFVSIRYTDTENTTSLPAYALHQVQLTYVLKGLTVSLLANNITNEFYTVMPFRPNPPRNFQLDISYIINSKKSK